MSNRLSNIIWNEISIELQYYFINNNQAIYQISPTCIEYDQKIIIKTQSLKLNKIFHYNTKIITTSMKLNKMFHNKSQFYVIALIRWLLMWCSKRHRINYTLIWSIYSHELNTIMFQYTELFPLDPVFSYTVQIHIAVIQAQLKLFYLVYSQDSIEDMHN